MPLNPLRAKAGRRRKPPPRRGRSFEILEPRTLLTGFVPAGVPVLDLAPDLPRVVAGIVAPGAPVWYRVDPAEGGRLSVRVRADGLPARLSLRDADGDLLVQSDGLAPGLPDPVVDLYVAAGTYYLELEGLRGAAGAWGLTAALTPTTKPFETLPDPETSVDSAPLALADFNGDGAPDFVARDGIHLGTGDGAFRTPPAGAELSPGGLVSSIVAADLNGDGRLDIAFGDQDLGIVSVALGRGDGTLEPALEAAALTAPVALVAADLDDDGTLDLAVATSYGQSVVVLLGQGDGTFTALDPIPFDGDPQSLAAADLDGDGDLDLAVVEYFGATVWVLAGRGDGTFADPAAVDAEFVGLMALTVADLDGDGRPDLAAADFDGLNVTILRNEGGLAFTTAAVVPTNQPPRTLTAADLNADGRPDLAVGDSDVNPGNGTVSVHLAEPGGGFGPPTALVSGTKPGRIVAADLTGSGRLDLLVSHVYSSEVSVLLSDGTGRFLPSTPPGLTPLATGDFNGDGLPDVVAADGVHLSTDEGTFRTPALALPLDACCMASGLAAADLDGDGRLDLAVTDLFEGTVLVLLGRGDGTFRLGSTLNAVRRPAAVAAGDLDGDGRADLAVAGLLGNRVTILLNQGGGAFLASASAVVGLRPAALAVGDLDGDGRLDVATADRASDTVTVLFGRGDGGFREALSLPAGDAPVDLAAADLDGDGRLDLAVASAGGLPGTGGVVVLHARGGGSFGVTGPLALGKISNPRAIVAADLNADGLPDLAVANVLSADVSVLLNEGRGGFRASPPIAFPGSPHALVAADLDGDGRPDLAVADEFARHLAVLPGLGDGRFQTRNANSIGINPQGSTWGDFNGDGLPDLAVPNFHSQDVSILLGNGDGTFVPGGTFPVGGQPDAVASADFNADGRADLVVCNYTSNDVTILLGNGDGTFRRLEEVATSSAPVAVAVGDLNGDRRPDIAVAGFDAHAITILLGLGDGTFRPGPTVREGKGPTTVALADLDADGKLDLVVSYLYSSAVIVSSGRGDGTFEPGVSIPTDDFAESFTVGDFDGDGRPDLAIVFDPGALRIVTRAADGGYVPRQTFSIGDFPVFVYNGDFNGDGALDVVAMYFNSDVGTIASGRGDGTFDDPADFRMGRLGWLSAIVTADLNGDGVSDLSMNTTGPDDVRVRLGLRGGGFANPGDVALAPRHDPVLADLTGDGTPDLALVGPRGEVLVRAGRPGQPGSFEPPIVANPGWPSRDVQAVDTGAGVLLASVDARADSVSLFGWSEGGFQRLWTLPTGRMPAQVVTGDLNGDGRADLVVRNTGDPTLTVYFNDAVSGPVLGPIAARPFGQRFLWPFEVAVGPGASDLALVDLDRDGRLDLVATRKATGTLAVLRNLDGRSFGPAAVVGAGTGVAAVDAEGLASRAATAGVAAGLFLPGARPGLAVANPGTNDLALLRPLGDGRLANPEPLPTRNPSTVVRAADFDGDGLTDLAALGAEGVEVFLADRLGGFRAAGIVHAGIAPTGLTVADVDRDGVADLIVGNTYGDVLVLPGTGDGRFRPWVPVERRVALAVSTSETGGLATMALAEPGQNRVSVLRGGGRDVVADASSGLLAPGDVALVDLDDDGFDDLVVANSGSNNVLVYPGLPGGSFGTAINGGNGVFSGTSPAGLSVADLDGDGRPDLAVANAGSNDVSVLLNRSAPGRLALQSAVRLRAGVGPTSTAVADVNDDGLPDILVTNRGSNSLMVLDGRGHGFFNDVNPTVIPTGQGPGPIIVVDPPSVPGPLGVVTLNAGSNDLTYIPLIGPGLGAAQTVASGGLAPVAGLALSLGGGRAGLLVANKVDGRLALFQGGDDGLDLARVIVQPALHVTALAADGKGNVYAGYEGGDSALLVTLGLGGPSVAQEVGDAGSSLLPEAPEETQVVLLLPLRDATVLTVSTLVSVTLDDPADGGPQPTGGTVNQPNAPETSAGNETGGDGAPPDEEEGPERPSEAEAEDEAEDEAESFDPFVDFLAGIDEAFDRAREHAKEAAQEGEPTDPDPDPDADADAVPPAPADTLGVPAEVVDQRRPVSTAPRPVSSARIAPARPSPGPPSGARSTRPVAVAALGLVVLSQTLLDRLPGGPLLHLRRRRPAWPAARWRRPIG